MKLHRFGAPAVLIAALVLGALVAATSAAAAPVTVNLRIEGSNSTIFEGPVTTDARMVTTAAGGTHPCDGTQNPSAHPANSPGPTPTTAVADAADRAGFTFDGQWNQFGSGDFFVERINSDGVVGQFDSNGNFWDSLVNRGIAQFGGCQIRVFNGDTVLLEWQDGNHPNLQLTAPSQVQVGTPFDVNVQQYQDQNGTLSPASGASVAGATTDANGHASVTFPSAGNQHIKATLTGAIRSNAADICVYTSSASECSPPSTPPATADTVAPSVALTGIADGKHFKRHKGPRRLSGTASDGGGLYQVYFRLRRFTHQGCQWYSSKRSVFTNKQAHCTARYQRLGTDANWSYLLPARLPQGSYVLDTKALDKVFNVARTHVEFTVAG
jgi:hypothetical protein